MYRRKTNVENMFPSQRGRRPSLITKRRNIGTRTLVQVCRTIHWYYWITGPKKAFSHLRNFNAALKFSKNNKQPGPDGLHLELLTWWNSGKRQCLLNLINTWWLSRKAPTELWIWQDLSHTKEGDTDNAANHIPISLLPSGNRLQFANWKIGIEIVDLPIKNGDLP